MGGKNVKNTIVERALQIIAPHPCFGCGKIGSVLCDYCKYDIMHEPFVGCFLCGVVTKNGICLEHNSPISRSFIVGSRDGVLKELINGLKFRYIKAAAHSAAALLHETLPALPRNTIVTAIPTVSSHIRQRGYDQAFLIAKHFASLRNLDVRPLLLRQNKSTQHVLNKQNRAKEATIAFSLNEKLSKTINNAPVLLIDDVITTGSTINEAAKKLQNTTQTIFVGALAYQPLD